MIKLNHLTVAYGSITALHGISLEIEPRSIVTLIGANGAGKSTTLRALSGLLPVKSGSIEYDGVDITRLKPHEIVARGLSHVPEGRLIFSNLTVRENLLMGAYLRKDRNKFNEEFDYIFRFFPRLKERLKQVAGTLSGGEQQMLAIGRILRTGAKLLMLDEPTEGLAPVIIDQIGATIRQLKERGFTILLVEQNFRFAATVADRFYVMDHGEMVDTFASSGLAEKMETLHEILGV